MLCTDQMLIDCLDPPSFQCTVHLSVHMAIKDLSCSPPCWSHGGLSFEGGIRFEEDSGFNNRVHQQKVILFALPLLFGSLVQQLYNTVDLIFVGNFIGKSASAAIGASSLLITCLVGFFGGMSVGSGVVISQIFGARDYKKLSRAVHNTAALCLAGGLALMVLGYILAPVFLRLINTPEAIRPAAVGYLRIYFLSFFSVVSYNLGSGVIRALEDSRTPPYAQIVVGVLFRVFNKEASVIALGRQIIDVTFPFYLLHLTDRGGQHARRRKSPRPHGDHHDKHLRDPDDSAFRHRSALAGHSRCYGSLSDHLGTDGRLYVSFLYPLS